MDNSMEFIIAIILAVLGASGFWTLLLKILDRKSSKTKLLLGLAHDRIIALGEEYIKRGCITKDEYENLIKYLGEPYLESGGNGLGKRILEECKKLPIK